MGVEEQDCIKIVSPNLFTPIHFISSVVEKNDLRQKHGKSRRNIVHNCDGCRFAELAILRFY